MQAPHIRSISDQDHNRPGFPRLVRVIRILLRSRSPDLPEESDTKGYEEARSPVLKTSRKAVSSKV
jgi:hypothetical protein